MQEVAAAYGAELTGAEEARERRPVERVGHDPGVVVGGAEQPRAPPVAGEQQRRFRVVAAYECSEVLVGRGCVAHVELHGRAHVADGPDGDGTALAVGAHDVAHDEIAALELGLVLVDDQAEVKTAGHELALVVR